MLSVVLVFVVNSAKMENFTAKLYEKESYRGLYHFLSHK